MEKTKENNIPNLVGSEGSSLIDIENEKRANILTSIKEKREERDTLLKQSSSLKTKISDVFGGNEGVRFKAQAKQLEGELYKNTAWQHELLGREIKKEAEQILEKTIKEPLSSIAKLYKQKENTKESGSNIDFKLEEQKIITAFKPENIVGAFTNKELRKNIVFDLRHFFDSKHNWQVHQNIKQTIPYSNKEAKGFPIDVAKSVLEGIHQAIQHEGVLNIEDDPGLFGLLNEVVDVCPDGVTEEIKNDIAELFIKRGLLLPMYKISQLPHLINMIETTPYVTELKSVLDTKLSDLFKQKKWFEIDFACKSYAETLSEMTLLKLHEYLIQYGLTLQDIQKPWGLYPSIGDSGFRNLETNMEKIEDLETERPGSVRTLFSDFNIREFRRYPTSLLVEQFDTRKIDIPYGVVLYTNQDHNQAFDAKADVLRSLFRQGREYNIGLRVLEFDSKYELMKNLARLNDRYGAHNKISYVLLGAHGEEDSFQTTYTEEVHKDDFEGKGVQKIKDFFVEQPEIILASCSTGAPNGIGQKISEMYGAKVYAPDKPTSVEDITMSMEGGAPTFSVQYHDNVLQSYIKGVKN